MDVFAHAMYYVLWRGRRNLDNNILKENEEALQRLSVKLAVHLWKKKGRRRRRRRRRRGKMSCTFYFHNFFSGAFLRI